MAVDIAINLRTGDFQFSTIRDLAIVQGENLIQQRVHVRLMIQRGYFIYDTTGTLGSQLRTLLDLGIPAAQAQIAMMIQDALEPMPDINVASVSVNVYGDGSGLVTDPRVALATLTYSINIAGAGSETVVTTPLTTTTFTLPI